MDEGENLRKVDVELKWINEECKGEEEEEEEETEINEEICLNIKIKKEKVTNISLEDVSHERSYSTYESYE